MAVAVRRAPFGYLLAALALLAGGLFLFHQGRHAAPAPIRIGVLHSLSGPMAATEAPLVDAARLAVEEINAGGGLLGRPVEMLLVDGASDWPRFAREAERLITRDKVSALFACWTSACRKAVKPVVERHQHLMFYPVQYEGLEISPHIVYTGSAPNQQIIPGTRWALDHLGRRVYLVGSDYIFPRAANRMVRDLAAASGGVVLGERYLPLMDADIAPVVQDIRRLRPQVILNTVNGEANARLFEALLTAGLGEMPVMSFSVAEHELATSPGNRLRAHYATWSYFQSLDTPENRRFVSAFKARYGADRVTSDPMEAAYVAIHLWARAVSEAGDDAPARVNASVLRQSMGAPSGIVSVDQANRHLWKMARIGQVQPDGRLKQVWATDNPLRPTPFPFYRTRREWQALVADLIQEKPP